MPGGVVMVVVVATRAVQILRTQSQLLTILLHLDGCEPHGTYMYILYMCKF